MNETTTTATPRHLRPTSCYVCGGEQHTDGDPAKGGHSFWSNADAHAYFTAEDAKHVTRSKEAAYVAEYRPY